MKQLIPLLVALFVFCGLRQTVAQVSFAPATNYETGSPPVGISWEPAFVLAADINGDGYLDLISVNEAVSSLLIFTNNGRGGFHSNTMFDVAPMPQCAVALDITGDGHLDLVSAGSSAEGNNLTVLTNNGSGGFGFSATLPGGDEPYYVCTADVNGDGYLDLIIADVETGTLSVLTNNGSGGFGASAVLNVGSEPTCVVAADVNGDGYLDLISGNYGSNTLTVWTNNGVGVFGSNATLIVGNGPARVVAADINGDGWLDLISANFGPYQIDSTITILTNNGAGVFGSNSTLVLGNYFDPYCLIAADLNGDGKLDLITANYNIGTLSVFLNTSVFPPPASTPPLSVSRQGQGVLVSWPTASAGWSL
jgi:FG-GAP-like repeat/EF hand